MADQAQKKRRYVFQVTRDEIVRTEIIKAYSQEQAEKILVESDPHCSYKFLWIKHHAPVEEQPKFIWLRIYLAFAAIFLVTGFLLLILDLRNSHYLFFAALVCLFMAAICEWWQQRRR